MLSVETTKALMEWEPINTRLITARFYGTTANISIIQGDAPTNDAELKKEHNSMIPYRAPMLMIA